MAVPAAIDLDDLVEYWTVLDDERTLVAGKRGATRLGFALLLKFYTRHGRFPAGGSDLPDAAVEFVARQVQVTARVFDRCDWLLGEAMGLRVDLLHTADCVRHAQPLEKPAVLQARRHKIDYRAVL